MNGFEFLKKIKFPKLSLGRVVFWIVTVALGVAAFFFARSFTSCWNLTNLPGVAPANCGQSNGSGPFNPSESTVAAPADLPPTPNPVAPVDVLPPAWDGASRINILLLGLDERDLAVQSGPPRSDTMMLVTIDPLTKTAGMLSIPRDMWVNIPGFGYGRINMAYADGEGAKLPGGGPGLAMKTVSQFIGVPVDYYLQVDFAVFTDIVSWLGCIEVNPTEDMILDPIGSGTDHFKLTTGGTRKLCQGWKVLAYARNRHTSGGDFDRAKRQQEVVLALQKKIFDPAVFPSMIAKAPQMYQELSYGIHTNMPFGDVLRLAVLGRDIPRESIKTGVIDTTMVSSDNVTLGGQNASILKPIADKIRVLRDEIFTSAGPLSPIAQGDLVTLMRTEAARVRVLDGTATPGLDQRAGQYFQSQGVNVTEVGSAAEAYSSTVVIVYGSKLYTVKYLQSVFGLSDKQIRFSPDPASTVDVEIRIGSDIVGKIP
jgi:LCP family protein required for cell wall assembly